MLDIATAPHPPMALAPPAVPLRIGVLVDSLEQPAWVERAVREVLATALARIVVVIVVGANSPARVRDATHSGWRYRLFAAYERFDRRWFSDGRLDPFERATLAPLVGDVARLDATLDSDDGALASATIDAIRGQGLDVILRFGVLALQHVPAGVARLGVWSVDSQGSIGDPEPLGGFWEVLRGSPITESTLVIDGLAGGRRRTIYRSYGSTSPVSVWKTRREHYWKVASFMARKLRDLAEQGASGITAVAAKNVTERASDSRPTNARLLPLLPRVAARYAKLQVERKASFAQWFVAYDFASSAPVEPGVPETSFARFRHLTPPRDRLWADPFPVYHRGQHYLFLEEMLYARNKGHISVIEFENDEARRPELVLETAHHLSYPFVFEWRNEMFMIPESARAGDSPAEQAQLSIPVFRATEFPRGWVQETAMLENLEVFDPTIAEIDGRWWLFCARGELGASSWDELHLFHAPTPFGPWTPHRRNPVKSDVRSARPAGRIFRRGGEWYRPAQDCSVRYGYGMAINRITKLTPTEYEEVVVQHIAPDWTKNLMGTHTINAAGRLSVVDGIRRRSRWSPDASPLPPRAPRSDR